MTVRRKKKIKMIIPLASMGDIAFLLIIFFMLVSSFMKNNQQYEPASSRFVQSVDAAQLAVTIDENEEIWVQGQSVSVGEIAGLVEMLVDEHPREVLVHVNIEKSLTRKTYMPVMEALSESGVKIVMTGLQGEP
jgi:biopolymer transport protein ExbD